MDQEIRFREELAAMETSATIRRLGSSIRTQQEWDALYALTFDADTKIAYRAAWTLTHAGREWNERIGDKAEELMDRAMACAHTGIRRMLMWLLMQPTPLPPRMDFLDFCLETMTDAAQPHAVRMYATRLGYAICRTCDDLLHEYALLLEIMEPDLLPPALRAVRRNVLAAMQTRRPLR